MWWDGAHSSEEMWWAASDDSRETEPRNGAAEGEGDGAADGDGDESLRQELTAMLNRDEEPEAADTEPRREVET